MHNNIVVKVVDTAIEEHASGIALAPAAIPYLGIITSVGPSCRSPEFVEGIEVLIPAAGGIEWRDNLDTYLIFLDHELYGVVDA